MKFKHKVLIGLVGLSLLLPMCAKQSESVDSTEQQQPIATQEVKQPTLAVHNFCKQQADRFQLLAAVNDGTCQNYRNENVIYGSVQATVTPTEIKLHWQSKEIESANTLIINRATKDSSHLFTLAGQNHSFDAPVELEETLTSPEKLIVVATTKTEPPISYAFVLQGDPSLLPSAAGY